MKEKQFWYFISYSLDGLNQGCINVQANSLEGARKNISRLGIAPKHYDDVATFIVEKNDLPPDILVSREKLIEMNFEKL